MKLFYVGLLFTVPYSSTKLQKLSPDFFKSDSEPYGVDVLLSVICLLELIVSMIVTIFSCLAMGRSMSMLTDLKENMNNNNNNNVINKMKLNSKY